MTLTGCVYHLAAETMIIIVSVRHMRLRPTLSTAKAGL